MKGENYSDVFEAFLHKGFIPAGYKITKNIELGAVPESSKYEALVVGLNDKVIFSRKGKVTPDRPGAFLAVWGRPSLQTVNGNKPVPLKYNELDYLFVQVQEHSNITTTTTTTTTNESMGRLKTGMFIFPISLLIEKGIVSSAKHKGKTGFRVFPPWSQDRGGVGTKVFSSSGKKTQKWQQPYFLEIDENGLIDQSGLKEIFANNKAAHSSD
ncbi:MAG: MepB family protein [Reichenbachiella sp.]